MAPFLPEQSKGFYGSSVLIAQHRNGFFHADKVRQLFPDVLVVIVDGGAEFGPMFTKGIFVDDIIQKAKVKVDEKGLEAAAATAVVMMRNTALPNPEEPVEFTADHPFRFAIIRGDDAPELLFWGQVMN